MSDFEIIQQEDLKTYLTEKNIDLATADDPNILIRDRENKYYRLGLGPFTLEARKEILTRLLKVQKNLKHPHDENYQLIQEDELKEIRRIWFNNGDFEDNLPEIYYEIFGHDLDWEKDDRMIFDRDELTQLELMCEEEGLDYRLMKKLLLIEKEHSEFKLKRGLRDQLSSALNQDYLYL